MADVVPERRLVAVCPGDTLDLDGVEARIVPAFHGVSADEAVRRRQRRRRSATVRRLRPRSLSVVSRPRLETSIVTADLVAALQIRRGGIDVALLPVNGRDAEREARGIVGETWTHVKVFKLALAVGATRLVPYHWDGFAGNTVPPGAAADAAAGRAARPRAGAPWSPLDVVRGPPLCPLYC